MFGFFKKKEELFKIVSPVSGQCIPITDVKDDVFSQKMMGDGFAVIPTQNTIVSPISGTIVTVFPTKHAIGIVNKDGVEIILHIGIDTVYLNGEGFTSLVKTNEKVKCGQPVIKMNKDFIESKGYDVTTMVIFTAGYNKDVNLKCYNQEVKAGDIIIA